MRRQVLFGFTFPSTCDGRHLVPGLHGSGQDMGEGRGVSEFRRGRQEGTVARGDSRRRGGLGFAA